MEGICTSLSGAKYFQSVLHKPSFIIKLRLRIVYFARVSKTICPYKINAKVEFTMETRFHNINNDKTLCLLKIRNFLQKKIVTNSNTIKFYDYLYRMMEKPK